MKTKTAQTLAALSFLILVCVALLSDTPVRACTDFCYSQGDTVLTGRSFDIPDNPTLGVLFVPATTTTHGWLCCGRLTYPCADGMNDQGLFVGDADVPAFQTTSSRQPADIQTFHCGLLANCATVDEAIAWCKNQPTPALDGWVHHNPQGGYTYTTVGHVLVADRSGDSVVFEWVQGKLKMTRKRGRYQLMTNFLLSDPQAGGYPCPRFIADSRILDNAAGLPLQTCKQVLEKTAQGIYTRYSVIYDLTHGDAYVYLRMRFDQPKTFHLADELQKGRHEINLDQCFLVPLDSQTYDQYAGQYHFLLERGPAGRQVTLAKSSAADAGPTLSVLHLANKTGDHLFASVHGVEAFPPGNVADFFPVSTNRFVVDPVLTEDNIQLTFAGVRNGKARRVIVNWNGNIFNGTRTAAATDFDNAGAEPDIQGNWEGVVHLEDKGVANGQEAQAHFVLRLLKTNGVYQATTDWPEWGEKNVPTVDVVYDYPNLVIHPTVRDTWSFKVNADATEMFWDRYIHFIEPNPVTLTRTTTPTPVPESLTESDFAPRPGSALQGYWEGEIGTGTDAVPVNLKIAEQADGTFRAESDSPMQGIHGRPVTVSYKLPVVEIRPADGAGTFSGQINDSNTEISGSWTQDGQSTPASVRRVDYQAEHAHDADKDYSFTSEKDLQGHWKGAWIAVFDGGKIKVPIRQALDIAKLPGGSYSATMANVDGIGVDAPVPASAFECSTNLHMEWKWEGWAYDGKLENGKIVGTWSEGGGGFSLVFERTN